MTTSTVLNRSELMSLAWKLFRCEKNGYTFSKALKMAWAMYKGQKNEREMKEQEQSVDPEIKKAARWAERVISRYQSISALEVESEFILSNGTLTVFQAAAKVANRVNYEFRQFM